MSELDELEERLKGLVEARHTAGLGAIQILFSTLRGEAIPPDTTESTSESNAENSPTTDQNANGEVSNVEKVLSAISERRKDVKQIATVTSLTPQQVRGVLYSVASIKSRIKKQKVGTKMTYKSKP